MRVLVAALATATAVILGLLALAAFNLHVFIDAHRDELVTRGERTLGRTVQIGDVTPSWWPIGIRFADVVIGEDPRFGVGPCVDAAAVRIAVRPGPLVLGRLEVSAIVLDRPRITLVRDVAGRWNVASLGDGEREHDGERRATNGERRMRHHAIRVPPLWLGLAATEIRDGHVDLEDRSGPTPRRLSAASVRLRASALRLGGDARVRIDAALFPGSVRPDAHAELQITRLGLQDGADTPFSLHLDLHDADLGTLATVAGRRERWSGRLAQVVADATGVLDRFAVDVDASADDAWRLGPQVAVPRLPSHLSLRAQATRDAIRVERASGAFGTLEWTAAGLVELRPWHVELTLQSVPESALAIGDARPPWRLSDVAVTVGGTDALHVESLRARLDDVHLEGTARVTTLDPFVADGHVRATGFGGVLDATFAADSTRTISARVEATGVDVGAIASRWSATPAVVGRADVSGDVAMPWAAPRPLAALSGTGTGRLVDGRIDVVNLAGRILRRFPAVRLLPRVVSAPTRARFPEIFDAPGTGIRTATLPFTITDGVLASSRAVIDAGTYTVEGDATLDTARELRARGDLVLAPDVSTALRADVPALRYLTRNDGQLVFPFRIHGPLGDPVPEPDLKRMRLRGVDALPATGSRREKGDEEDRPLDAPAVERFERLLRP